MLKPLTFTPQKRPAPARCPRGIRSGPHRKAAEALRYLGRNYPECLENLWVLDEHETASCAAAMAGDRDAYLEALRCYMRAGRDEALRIRRGAA